MGYGFRNYQGWFSSGRNLFLPEDSEESGNKYFFRGFFQKKLEEMEEIRKQLFFSWKKDTKTQSIEVKSTNFIIYTTNSHKTHLE